MKSDRAVRSGKEEARTLRILPPIVKVGIERHGELNVEETSNPVMGRVNHQPRKILKAKKDVAST